jgi:hypothetical protein
VLVLEMVNLYIKEAWVPGGGLIILRLTADSGLEQK